MTHRAPTRRSRALAGTATLIRLNLRLDRVRLPIWLVLLIGLCWLSAAAVQDFYGNPEQIATYRTTVGNSAAARAMNGPALGLDTVGGITAFEVGTTIFLGTALMAIFLTTRHTRADEESGRTELVLAGVVNRKAPIIAAAVVVGTACVIVGAGVATSFVGNGLDPDRSVLYGMAVALTGLSFMAITLVAAQVTANGRGATGIALGVLGVSFLLRAVGDVTDNGMSWLSPLGWGQQVGAFGPARVWPLLLSAAFVVACVILARRLIQLRDFGAGLVQPRPGPADASRRLRGTFALALRLQRGVIIGWTVAALALGVAYGSFGREVEKLVESNPQIRDMLTAQGGGDVVASYFETITLIGALMLAGFVVASVLRLNTEETQLRAEPLLAAPVPRLRWAISSLAVTVLGTTLLLFVYGIGMGATQSMISGDDAWIGRLIVESLAYVPATLVLGAVTFVVFGWLPKAVMIGWAALAACVVIGWLGPLLELPNWVIDLSPFQHGDAELVLAGVAAAVAVIGLAGFRRRDLATA